jgi:myo-inositol catabolism protein IolC
LDLEGVHSDVVLGDDEPKEASENMAIAEMTQTVKVVIDGNRLVMEHAQENWQKKLDDDRAISKWGC